MTPERWQQIEKLFYSILEVEPSRRDDFLDEACGGDEELHRALKSLLASIDEGGTFFETLRAEVAAEIINEDKAGAMTGRTLGRYRFLSPLGAGGMGEVYRALDTRLDREVAVKILPERLAANPEALLRFEREAKAVAALSHPNILSIHDYGTEEGVSYAVMELLNGETLRSRLSKSAMTWRKAVGIGVEIAEGLSAAHAKGITHRDLKPENIFLTSDGKTKILDFGLARFNPGISSEHISSAITTPLVTRPGVVMGTNGYMSPEQVRGDEVDATSDIFSFGCVLYEMVIGRKTFIRRTEAETMAAILKDNPPELTGSGKSFPMELERIMIHCLEKNPGERFQSARDLAFALRELSAGQKPSQQHFSRRSWIMASLALLTLLAVFYLFFWRPAPPTTISNLSLAVLPLENYSGKSSQEPSVDTITSELISTFGGVKALRVISRDSAIQYKGTNKSLKDIALELNVGLVVRGSVQYLGDSVQVNVSLFQTESGEELFKRIFECKAKDISTLENQIVQAIVQEVRADITPQEQARLARKKQVNPEANNLYSQGLTYLDNRGPDDISKAIECFRSAVGKDPGYAVAWAAIAKSYIVGDFPWPESSLMAHGAAKKALELDDNLAEAHASLASVNMLSEWNWLAADTEFKKAIELNGSDVTARHWYAEYLSAMGHHNEAIAEIEKAVQISPLSLIIKRDVGWHYYCAGQYDDAIAQLRKTLKLAPPGDKKTEPVHWLLGYAYVKKSMFTEAIDEMKYAVNLNNNSSNRARLIYAYACAGRRDEALRQLEDLKKESSDGSPDLPFLLATVYGELGDKDQAFACLDQVFDRHSGKLVYLNVVPMLDSLRSDQRFRSLTLRVGLPQ